MIYLLFEVGLNIMENMESTLKNEIKLFILFSLVYENACIK